MRFLSIFVAVSVLAPGGCGSRQPDTVEVTGIVTMNGQAIDGANVVFYPVANEGGLACQARTDDSGRFQLRTHVGRGAYRAGIAAGTYAVTVSKFDTESISKTLGPPANLLPAKYANQSTSGLIAEVAAQRENHFEFSLDGE
jgi:hypothetical protein